MRRTTPSRRRTTNPYWSAPTAELVARCRDLQRRLAAGRDRDGRRGRDRCARGRRLRLHLHLPRSAAASGVAQGDDERRARSAGRHREVAERERLRIGEEERRVGGGEVREARALYQHRCFDRPARVSPRGACCGHERGLHLLRRPRRMPLEEQCDGAGHVRRGEARPAENCVLVTGELDERRRDDVVAGRGDVRLELVAKRREARRREGCGHAGPARRYLGVLVRGHADASTPA